METIISVPVLLCILMTAVNCNPLASDSTHTQLSKAYVLQVPYEKQGASYQMVAQEQDTQNPGQERELVIVLPRHNDADQTKERVYDSAASYYDQSSSTYEKYYSDRTPVKSAQDKSVDYMSPTSGNYPEKLGTKDHGRTQVEEFAAGLAEGIKYGMDNSEVANYDSGSASDAYVSAQSSKQLREYKTQSESDQSQDSKSAKKVPLVLITIHKDKKQESDEQKQNAESSANYAVSRGSSAQTYSRNQGYGVRLPSSYPASSSSGSEQAENSELWKPVDKFGLRNTPSGGSSPSAVQLHGSSGASVLQNPTGYNNFASQSTAVASGYSGMLQTIPQSQAQSAAALYGQVQNSYGRPATSNAASPGYVQQQHRPVVPTIQQSAAQTVGIVAPETQVRNQPANSYASNQQNNHPYQAYGNFRNPTQVQISSNVQHSSTGYHVQGNSAHGSVQADRSQVSVQSPGRAIQINFQGSGYSGQQQQVSNGANDNGRIQGGLDSRNINTVSVNTPQNSYGAAQTSASGYGRTQTHQQVNLNNAAQQHFTMAAGFGVQQTPSINVNNYQSQPSVAQNAAAQVQVGGNNPNYAVVQNYGSSNNAQRYQLEHNNQHVKAQSVDSGYRNVQGHINVANQGQSSQGQNLLISQGNVQTHLSASVQGQMQGGNYLSGPVRSHGQNYGTTQNVASNSQYTQGQIGTNYLQQNAKIAYLPAQVQSVEEKQRLAKQQDAVSNYAHSEGQRGVSNYSPFQTVQTQSVQNQGQSAQNQGLNIQNQEQSVQNQGQSGLVVGHVQRQNQPNTMYSQGMIYNSQQVQSGNYPISQTSDNTGNFRSQQQNNQVGYNSASSGQNIVVSKSVPNYEQSTGVQTSDQSASNAKDSKGVKGKSHPEALLVVLVSAKKNQAGEDTAYDNSQLYPQTYSAPAGFIDLTSSDSITKSQIQAIESQAESGYEQLSHPYAKSNLYALETS